MIRAEYKNGARKVMLKAPTGAGKTTIFSNILGEVASRGFTGSMIVRGRQLVDQASKRLTRDGVYHGVRMANHWNKKYSAPIQVCSIDTLIKRREYPKAKQIVIDEGHLFVSQSCVEYIEGYDESSLILAVTATPYTRESLRHIADVVVEPITVSELIHDGFLVDARYYTPSKPNLDGVQASSLGDYVTSQLQQRMNPLTGDIVKHWAKLAENRPTLCFAVSIQHSEQIVAEFNAAGIRAEHIEASHTFAEREAAIGRLVRGETKILSNVGILCTGVDIPEVGCILQCRPTKSLMLHIQILGRGTRPAPGKEDFIVLDHAGNCLRHGFITDEHEVDLDGRKRVSTGPAVKECAKCYRTYSGFACPECGDVQAEKGARVILVEEGVLEELAAKKVEDVVLQYIIKKREEQRKHGYKKQWLWYQVRMRFGESVANEVLPKARPRGYQGSRFPGGLI